MDARGEPVAGGEEPRFAGVGGHCLFCLLGFLLGLDFEGGSDAEKGEEEAGDEGEGEKDIFRLEVGEDEKQDDEDEPDGRGEKVDMENEAENGAGDNADGEGDEEKGLVKGAGEEIFHARKVARDKKIFNPPPAFYGIMFLSTASSSAGGLASGGPRKLGLFCGRFSFEVKCDRIIR